MNYKLTVITFTSTDTVHEFIDENQGKWAKADIDGTGCNFYVLSTWVNESDLIYTVVFAKKARKAPKEARREDCQVLLKELGRDWNALCSDGVYTLEHDRTGRIFKGIKAKSWRGLLRVIRRLSDEWIASCGSPSEQAKWLKRYDLVNW